MSGCFGNNDHDRWLSRLTDEHTDPPVRKLSAWEKEKLEELGLDESDLPGTVPAFMGGEE